MSRINKANKKDISPFYHHTQDSPPHIFHPWELTHSDDDDDDDFEDETPLNIGLFGPQERAMFMQEILQQVVVGMGRLDVGVEPNITDPIDEQPTLRSRDTINPYFPKIPPPPSSSTVHPWSSSAPSISMESTSLRSWNIGPINDFSPGTEFPPGLPSTSPSRSLVGSGSTINVNW